MTEYCPPCRTKNACHNLGCSKEPAPLRGEHEQWAAKALEYLQLARTAAKNAKAPRTLERIDAAISSAKGAVRAGRYRDWG